MTAARLPLYSAAVAVAVVLQALPVYFHAPHALEIGEYVVPPLLTTLVYAFVWADMQAEPPGSPAIWERFLERAWAVIVIDFIATQLFSLAFLTSAGGDLAGMLASLPLLLLSGLIVFADAIATAEDGIAAWWLVPWAFWRSVRVSWNAVVLMRAIAILALWLLAGSAANLLSAAFGAAHLPAADFWGEAPLTALLTPPIAALTLLVYRDAQPASCSG